MCRPIGRGRSPTRLRGESQREVKGFEGLEGGEVRVGGRETAVETVAVEGRKR
jgi:hypothetical protein